MPKKQLAFDPEVALKKKKTSKIIALVALVLVAVLAVLIIVAACVQVDLKPRITAQPDRIAVYSSSSKIDEFEAGSEKYDEFMQQYNEMFKSSYLVSLFSGRLGDYKIEEPKEKQSFSSVESSVLKQGYYVRFIYDNDNTQTVRYQSGKEYNTIFGVNETLSFNSIYFAVSEDNKLSNVDMYVVVKYSGYSSDYVIKISQKANTSNLYKTILAN